MMNRLNIALFPLGEWHTKREAYMVVTGNILKHFGKGLPHFRVEIVKICHREEGALAQIRLKSAWK